jgi:L-iduronidase
MTMPSPATRHIRVDAARPLGPQRQFWRSTGFTPAELLLLPEMQQTLDYLAALPNRGVEYLRVHYLLNLVTAQPSARGHVYDWTLLDRALDVMVTRRMKPFFEIMGNPSEIFTGFDEIDSIRRWRDLTSELVARCRARYGADEVRGWYFESWNEPDLPWWPWGERGYMSYYDACVEGLAAVDPALRIGGPGTARPLSSMFKAFVAHCDTGENCLTGATGVRLDFISVHEKGAKKHAEDLQPHTLGIIEREMQAVRYLRQHHPRLAGLPFINNECDPQVGWIIPHTWHALPYFAGLIVKIIDQHQRLMIEGEGVDYDVLSNDNGFIGRWGHRTHLAYFGGREIKAAQAEHRTDHAALAKLMASEEPFDLVKKPGLTVMELLSALKTQRLAVSAEPALSPDTDGLGLIATGAADGVAVLLYNSVDRIWRSGESAVTLTLDGLPAGEHDVAVFRLDDDHGTAYWVWEAVDAPDRPDAAALAAMRARQEVALDGPPRRLTVDAKGDGVTLAVTLPLPGTALVVAEPAGQLAPAPIGLSASRHHGLNGTDDMLLTWSPAEGQRLVRFELLYSLDEGGPFAVVTPSPLISSAFLHANRPGPGFYRLRSLNLAGEATQGSDIVAA